MEKTRPKILPRLNVRKKVGFLYFWLKCDDDFWLGLLTIPNSGLFWMFYVLFICRPSDSTVSQDAGMEPRTVATSALADRRSNHSASSHPHSARSHPHSAIDIIHTRLDFIHTRLDLIHTRQDLIHTRLDLIHTRLNKAGQS
jgi:hypothetical protein